MDGIFLSIADKTHDLTHIQNIMDKDTNLVIFDKYSKLTPCSSVVIDDRKAAYIAVEHLIKKGKKRIAHFRGPLLPQNSIDRFLGYKQALEENGIEYDKDLVFICDEINDSEGYDHMQLILDQKMDVDAIFAVADLPARLALPAALLLEEVDQLARADLLTVVEVVPHVLLRQVLREGAARREEATRGGDSAAGISTAWHGSP